MRGAYESVCVCVCVCVSHEPNLKSDMAVVRESSEESPPQKKGRKQKILTNSASSQIERMFVNRHQNVRKKEGAIKTLTYSP